MITFKELYKQHAPSLMRFAYWLSGDFQEAQDIVSETFVRAWAGSSRIRQATLRAYLFAIARNYFLELQRANKSIVKLEEDELRGNEVAFGMLEVRDDLDEVIHAMNNLSETERSTLLLRAVEGMSYAEIASALGITEVAAKVRVHRARQRIAKQLDPGVKYGN